jgi:hypothetical protein
MTPDQKESKKVYVAAWGKRNPEKRRRVAHRHKLMSRYGITLEDYEKRLANQGGVCAICGGDDPQRGRFFFCVDHDHRTGKIRGLLCVTCNDGLGRFGDDRATLLRAAAYLGGDF